MVFSRSHGLSKEKILEAKKAVFKKFNANKIIRSGSSIKLCYIADGTANIYPRHGTTMEWDIAAGDAILRYAGGRIKTLDRKIVLNSVILKWDVVKKEFNERVDI